MTEPISKNEMETAKVLKISKQIAQLKNLKLKNFKLYFYKLTN